MKRRNLFSSLTAFSSVTTHRHLVNTCCGFCILRSLSHLQASSCVIYALFSVNMVALMKKGSDWLVQRAEECLTAPLKGLIFLTPRWSVKIHTLQNVFPPLRQQNHFQPHCKLSLEMFTVLLHNELQKLSVNSMFTLCCWVSWTALSQYSHIKKKEEAEDDMRTWYKNKCMGEVLQYAADTCFKMCH